MMLLSLLVAPALALTCEEIGLLIEAGVPTTVVIQTINAAAPPPDEADVKCLSAMGADPAVVEAAQLVVPKPKATWGASVPSTAGCDVGAVAVSTLGLSEENAEDFVGRGPDLRKYLNYSCDRVPLTGGAYLVEIYVKESDLFIVLAEVRTDPSPWAWVSGKDLRTPFDAVWLKRQGVLAKALHDWAFEVVRPRKFSDPVRRAVSAATYAVRYDRADLGESLLFAFAPDQGRMYPQAPIIFRSRATTRLFLPSTMASSAALSRDWLFALDPPDTPDLAGKLPGTDVIYRFFGEPRLRDHHAK